MSTATLRFSVARRKKIRFNNFIGSVATKRDFNKINIILVIMIGSTLFIQAVLVNHLNTINFRLEDLATQRATLVEEKKKLESIIVEKQSLEELQKQAETLGMVPVGEYRFITVGSSAVAQR